MWRLLEEGEITQEGDEYFEYHLSAHGTWVAVGQLTQGLPFIEGVGHPVRRKISQTKERNDSAGLCPHYSYEYLTEIGIEYEACNCSGKIIPCPNGENNTTKATICPGCNGVGSLVRVGGGQQVCELCHGTGKQ